MTGATNAGDEAPRDGLSAPESLQDPEVGTERQPGGAFGPQTGAQSREGEQLRADAEAWRHKAIRRALTISKLRGTIDATLDLADEQVSDRSGWGDGYRAAIADLREVLREFGHIEAGDDGPAATGPREQQARPAHPDGTPYRYHEIVAEGWEYCDGCHMWTTATQEQPHRCAQTFIRGPFAPDAGPSVAEAAANDVRWPLEKAGE